MPELGKLLKEIADKRAEIALYLKSGASEVGVFKNTTDFRGQYYTMQNSGFCLSSSKVKIENRPYVTGYPFKQGVKLTIKAPTEPTVEAGGGNDLYGVCVDVHEFSSVAQIVPVTDGMAYACVLIAKDNSIKRNDKVKFNDKGEVEKQAGAGAYHGIALEDSLQIEANKLNLVKIMFLGVKPA